MARNTTPLNFETIADETTITNPKIKTPYNAKFHSKNYEKPIGVSQTIPDQSLSVKDIMQRFASGLPVTENADIRFFEDEDPLDGVEYQKLDLSERQEYIKKFQEELYQLQQKAAWEAAENEKKLIDEPKALGTDPTKDQI